ncbi:3'-nucleotidase/nuclease (plasmid) [Legionella adelaidensis]|uniref:3'-nucleotidase/nuclease n=1 Tax=Legionella adelaidensis TaxID=45056 RepID=A0A0W0R1X9_9GAMM|nr:3'-nucleotidase/nuclease [Legionella adelaidensis]VEH85373.1 3'-nucleotidase/nuclease [Legionella adelaidensis]
MVLFLITFQIFSWNALGHRAIVQIAMHHLTPHAKHTFASFNQALDTDQKYQSLVNAATWLDDLRFHDSNWFNTIHYCDLAFAYDETPLPSVPYINAIWGINEAKHTLLSNRANAQDKGLALRILLHVVGDIHQPLHSATLVSKEHPKGDLGGNLFHLGENPVADNLHSYWDKGGGLLSQHYSNHQFETFVAEIERKWPCAKLNQESKSAKLWGDESHRLAKEVAYQLGVGEIPSSQYQQTVKNISEERISLAGCRLASVLNGIDAKLMQREHMVELSDG